MSFSTIILYFSSFQSDFPPPSVNLIGKLRALQKSLISVFPKTASTLQRYGISILHSHRKFERVVLLFVHQMLTRILIETDKYTFKRSMKELQWSFDSFQLDTC